MAGVKWTDNDAKMKMLERELKQFARVSVTVGVHGTGETGKNERGQYVTVEKPEGGKADATVAQIAAWQEFGTEKIPERSFLRAGIKEGMPEIIAAYDQMFGGVIDQKVTARQASNLIGVVATGQVRAKIFNGLKPELSVATRVARLRRTKAGRGLVNRGMKALRSAVNGGNSASGFARWTGGVGKHGRWVKSKGKNLKHQKALMALEDALSDSFQPLRDTGQLVGSIAYQVDKKAKGGR